MQAINFSIVPVHMRVPFAAGVSFVWSCILSALRGDMKPVVRVVDEVGVGSSIPVAVAKLPAAIAASPREGDLSCAASSRGA